MAGNPTVPVTLPNVPDDDPLVLRTLLRITGAIEELVEADGLTSSHLFRVNRFLQDTMFTLDHAAVLLSQSESRSHG